MVHGTSAGSAAGLTRKQLEHLEKRLRKERERTLQTISQFDESTRTTDQESDGDLSLFPIHAADQASDSMEREVDFAIAMGTGERFEEIEEALRLIYEEPEHYGTCTNCGQPIPFERLDLIPWTRMCQVCEAVRESGEVAAVAKSPATAQMNVNPGPATLRAIMATDVFTLPPEATIREAAELFADKNISGAPVVRGDRILGVISARDILEFSADSPGVPAEREEAPEPGDWNEPHEFAEGGDPAALYFLDLWQTGEADVAERFARIAGPEWDVLSEHGVEEIMTRRLCALPPDASIADAARYMLRTGVHRVLVVEHGRLIGVVTTTDFLRAIAQGKT
jgi:CBS domain-containing protein/RNA polymerase-binding transcription factor DksA